MSHEDGGDCFVVAAEMMNDPAGPRSATLVHGLPVGRGVKNAGRRFWHAWVEVFDKGTMRWIVVDRSNGRRIVMLRTDYYAHGQLDDSTVYRYSRADAARHTYETGNYGPWVDGWEGMGL